jgi:chemotaxis receptor (MCP) glutamine deamidase CheD
MSHVKFRRELVMALVGDFHQGGGASTRRTSMSDKQQRLNGMLHVIIPHPEKKHED